MRLVVLGGLVIGALAFALLFMIDRELDGAPVDPPAAPPAGPAMSRPTAGSAPPASGTAPVPRPITHAPRRAPIMVYRAPLAMAPSAPELAPGPPKKKTTPIDELRWALMRAIRTTEPAVIDCLDQAKQAGVDVDGTSIYGFYVARKGDQIVFDGSSFESGQYPASLDQCLQDVTNNVVVDFMPDGAKRVQALRRLVVEHGAITTYKLKSFHVRPAKPAAGQ
ncbi:MAG: hypothetical protein ABI467_25925 [Kofleriaceae bacterium]